MTGAADSSVPTKVLSIDDTFFVFYESLSRKCLKMKTFFTFYSNLFKN